MQNMEESLYEKMRDKVRFNVELNATYSIKGQSLSAAGMPDRQSELQWCVQPASRALKA